MQQSPYSLLSIPEPPHAREPVLMPKGGIHERGPVLVVHSKAQHVHDMGQPGICGPHKVVRMRQQLYIQNELQGSCSTIHRILSALDVYTAKSSMYTA